MQSVNNQIVFDSADELAAFVSEKSRTAATAAASNLIPMMLRHVATSLASSFFSSDSPEEERLASEIIARIAAGIQDFANEFESNPPSTSTAMAGDADS